MIPTMNKKQIFHSDTTEQQHRPLVRTMMGRWLPPLAWMAVIFAFSAQPSLPHAPEPWLELLIKKGGHAWAYGVLAWLYWRALRPFGKSRPTVWRGVCIALALAYALSDEYHQTFVPGRNGNLFDVAVDGLGAGIAMGLERWWSARQRSIRQRSMHHPPV